jgi:hypothetical protein
MGSVSDAYDNAMAESFFSTIEAELVSRRRFASQAGAVPAVSGATLIRRGPDFKRWRAA